MHGCGLFDDAQPGEEERDIQNVFSQGRGDVENFEDAPHGDG
jgi:hypothetical protein